jgi:hypothetical protein
MPTWLLIVLAMTGIVIVASLSKKSGIRRVRRYGTEQGWEMLVIDSFTPFGSDSEETFYRVRFRERDGALVEGILESRTFGDLILTKSQRISKDVERGMFDSGVTLDCRKCGSVVPPGVERCPYCRSARDELRIA